MQACSQNYLLHPLPFCIGVQARRQLICRGVCTTSSYALCFLCAHAGIKTNWYAEEFSERPVNPTFVVVVCLFGRAGEN